ncbi:hypothetical protein AOL_s00083g448 [Orbilia oligospora ATCC 24927]|uniref:Uncharacterized protein n=1 Tax=Arthrobotrys oligospora (strain ATCC 24927 / CBS 115.81 / DSM 1491) TaxID=756982 RepID=G1XHG7_ARTOA|nr:hypothetical protein AOL_s00083g448 [Orbilia oligospora ATCC 24927]EGX47355.1 hypothetical protein AOL_s00083g448 [Orbilia oligospora ATCC 24927]
MPPRSESMPPPSGLGASRWAAPPGPEPPGPTSSDPRPVISRPEIPLPVIPRPSIPRPSIPRPAIPRPAALRFLAPKTELNDSLGLSRSADLPANSPDTFDAGSSEPYLSSLTATTIEESAEELQADPAPRTHETWHHGEETESKIILHLEDIECVVRGTVDSKDGAFQDVPTIKAVAKLSIELDKVLVLDKKHDFMAPENGGFLEKGSTVSLNVEGDTHQGQGPALRVVIREVKNRGPDKPTGAGAMQVTAQNPFPPTSRDAVDLNGREFEGEYDKLPQAIQNVFAHATTEAKVAVEETAQSSRASVAASPLESDGATPSRSVIIAGLPYGFKVKQVLDLIEPTKNTGVIEIKLTKAYAALFSFLTPAGAQDFLSQWKSGFITFPYEDEELGRVEWRSRVLPWGVYVPVKPSLRGYIEKGATRYLCIHGRNPITIREANLTWSLDNYRHCLGNHIYDGRIYRDDQDTEIAELEFLSVSRAVQALHFLKPKDGFARATFTFLPDRHVLL